MSARKAILTISLANHLHGTPIQGQLDSEWAMKTSSETRERFDNVGFDLDPADLVPLYRVLAERTWDGVLIGWCSRGYPERTELFENVVDACAEEIREGKGMKLLFCTGPTNLVEATMRSFPVNLLRL